MAFPDAQGLPCVFTSLLTTIAAPCFTHVTLWAPTMNLRSKPHYDKFAEGRKSDHVWSDALASGLTLNKWLQEDSLRTFLAALSYPSPTSLES